MGDWLQLYGEAVYETKGGPYKPDSVYAATRKGNIIYLHVFQHANTQMSIPSITNLKVLKAYFLKGTPISFTQNGKNITMDLPEKLPNENDTVVVLEMNANVEDIPVVENKYEK